MYRDFLALEELKQAIVSDKTVSTEVEASNLNRFPLRFILTDSFDDCFKLVEWLQTERQVHVESVDKWMDTRYPDLMMTYQELGEAIEGYVKRMDSNDGLVAPFSELARFYDNTKDKTFDALIKSIKGIQGLGTAQEEHQRIYIPIVGLEEKMQTFRNESQIVIWHLKDPESVGYRVIIMNDTECFGVKGLDFQYNVVHNLYEWLNIWKDNEAQKKHTIITTSRTIFTDSVHANPDNAFTYMTPRNVYEFLTKGLGLTFDNITYKETEEDKWRLLAQQIDVSNPFSFSEFVQHYFGVTTIEDSIAFLKVWFSHSSSFDRWLLSLFYLSFHSSECLLCRCLGRMADYSNRSLFTEVALDMTTVSTEVEERRNILNIAAANNVVMTEEIKSLLSRRLEAISQKMGYKQALQYFTRLTAREREIALVWLGKGHISSKDVKAFFPELALYMQSGLKNISSGKAWLDEYFQTYKQAKISNQYSDEIENQIREKNADSVAFDTWYQSFKTTRTLLSGRSDIEVFYWIDGLGIDWIPFVSELIRQHQHENVYLNDVMIARALLPTTTTVNKEELQKLSDVDIQGMKVGDLDSLAHRSTNVYPQVLVEEFEVIKSAINKIVNSYAGKKVAIVSDHGLTYLSQLCGGLNLGGLESDHHGRLAFAKSEGISSDKNYFVLEDGKTLCSLSHKSLCGKVPRGQGIHGGCTPEEVLVPVFIVSSSPNESSWTAYPLTDEVLSANPIVKFHISGLASSDTPYLIYNDKQYGLTSLGNEEFISSAISLVENDDTFIICVNNVMRPYRISVNMGATMSDLFDF